MRLVVLDRLAHLRQVGPDVVDLLNVRRDPADVIDQTLADVRRGPDAGVRRPIPRDRVLRLTLAKGTAVRCG